jgi:hypothetical protein
MNILSAKLRVFPLLGILTLCAARAADYPAAVLSDGPLAYYRFGEASPPDIAVNQGSLGPAGNATHGPGVLHRVSGALAGDNNAAAGYAGAAHTFVAFNPLLNPPSGSPFTVEYWARPSFEVEDTSGPCPLFNCVSSGNRSGWAFFQRAPANGWNCRFYSGSGSSVGIDLLGGTNAAGGWSHIVVVWTGSAASLYLNGTLVDGPKSGVYKASTSATFSIGAYDNGYENPFNGAIDEVAIYTNALTADEILAHYQNATNASRLDSYESLVLAQNPVEYLRLDESDPKVDTAINLGTAGEAADGLHFPGLVHQVPGALAGSDDTAAEYSAIDSNSTDGGVPTIIPYNAALNPAGSFTVEAWLKPALPTASNQQCPLYNRITADGTFTNREGWDVFQQPSGWRFRMFNGNQSQTAFNVTAGPLIIGNWQHLVAVYDASVPSLTVYVNGVPSPAGAPLEGTYAPNSSAPFAIGGFPPYSNGYYENPFTGAIDEVALYSTNLSAAQVLAHFQNGTNAARSVLYETLIAADHPVAYYRLNEPARNTAANFGSLGAAAEGTYAAADFSGYSSQSSLGSGPQAPAFSGFESTNADEDFDGYSGYVELGNPGGLNFGGLVTLEAWVQPSAFPGSEAYILAHGGNDTFLAETALRIENNFYQILSHNGVDHKAQYPIPVEDLGQGQWVHLAGTWDGSRWNLYRNGVLVAAAEDSTGALPVDNANWAIGARGRWKYATGLDRLFAGGIDEAAIYSYALSPERIAAHYVAGAFGANTLPVFSRQPVSGVTVFPGASPTFGAAAIGYPLPRYQWRINGTNVIAGATNAAYTVTNAQLADSGMTLSCSASNLFGLTNSTSAVLTVIPPPAQPYPAAVLADSPAGYWRLDEGPDNGMGNNGMPANDYRGGHNGRYNAALLQTMGYNPVADPDTAAEFGMLSYGDSFVTDIQDLTFAAPSNTSAAFSVEAWVEGYGQYSDAGIVAKGYGGGGEQFALDTGGVGYAFRFFVRDAGGGAHAASGAVAPDGCWHHLVGVCDEPNGIVALYVDGMPAGTAAILPTGGLLASSSPVSIGSRQTGAGTSFFNQFSGSIDEVALYSHALSASQVLNHFYAAQYPPSIILEPNDLTVNEGTTAIFCSQAYGAPSLGYQWYDVTGGDPGIPISGQTCSNLVLSGVAASQSFHFYRVVVTNAYGAAVSPPLMMPPVRLEVRSGLPFLISDLAPQVAVYSGRTASLSVIAGGTEPFSYTWRRNGVEMADGGRITGTHRNWLTIAGAQAGDSAGYQLLVSNRHGFTNSVLGSVRVQSVPALNTNGAGWTVNSSPTGRASIDSNKLSLTVGQGSTAASAFYDYPMYIGAFSASFTYQAAPTNGADGMAFCLQNDPGGAMALGGGGGRLGYSGISPSAAILFNIYAPNTVGLALGTNGAVPGAGGYGVALPVSIAGGNPIGVAMRYSGSALRLTLTDSITAASFSTNIAVNFPAILGTNTAFVGFTGADGGISSTQNVTDFTYIPLPMLAVEPTSTNTLLVTWPTSVGGFDLESTTNLSTGEWLVIPVAEASSVVIPHTGSSTFYRLHLAP